MQTLASLSLAPGPDTVPKALAWLESVAQNEHWTPRMAFKLSLCLDEALSNIVMYGFHDKPDGEHTNHQITLAILTDTRLLAIDIIDNGAPFDPIENAPKELATSLDEARIGGHGLRLMQHYLHDIRYRWENGQNHLRLTAAPDSMDD